MIPHKNLSKYILRILTFWLFTVTITAQQTASYTNKMVDYNKALELYNNNQFYASQMLFSQVKANTRNQNIKGDCDYYIASAAVRLNQKDADKLMGDFVTNYPTHLKRNKAFIDVANYYFDNGKYARARKWFDKVDETSLSPSQRESFYFKNGYAYFKNKRYNEAKKYFNKVADSPKFGSQAKYYLGYIAYQNDDYTEANQRFEEVKTDGKYGKELSYYQADMNFKLGNFEKAIKLGKQQFDSGNPKEKSELAKIIGESYFNLQQYDKAIPYLEQYKGKKGKWNNTDYYQLGYAYYKQGNYQEAINRFNKIIDGNNHVAQNAFYHLAESYLKLNQKQQALNAFKNASEMSFSPEIQEDAYFNYAKLSYEIGNNYKSTPQVLLDFLKKYPDNPNNSLIKDLLIDSYITAKDFKRAMQLLENNKSFRNKLAYQKVAFLRGAELFSEGKYNEAKKIFNRSLKEPHDKQYVAKATFWKAEADYQLHDFEEAQVGFKQFLQLPESQNTTEYKNANYHLGYTYFKQKKYPDAQKAFAEYVAQPETDLQKKADAYLRLADSYFISSDYWKALENYNKAIENKTHDTDYAVFQKSISYGFVDKISNKIEGLKSFDATFPKSIYRDDALYELGNTYLSQNKTNKALVTFDKLITKLPGSNLAPKAMLKKALLLDNSGKSNQALDVFKAVVKKYPDTPEALQAVASAKLIYIDQGKVAQYADWVNTLDFVAVENAELDDATYKAAEQPYLENKPTIAIKRLEEYLKQFPNGKHNTEANFYLGQIYFKQSKTEKALLYYKYVADKDKNEFTEQALARVSELLLQKSDYKNALPYLLQLETQADFPQNKTFALTNAMKAYYELKQYFEATQYAEKVLENPKIDNQVKSDAKIIIARSAMKMGDENKAKLAYQEVAEIVTGKLAAEALYYDAYFKNKSGLFEDSNASVQKLAKDYSGYKFWGAKGLVLMAKNFYGLKDAYQATYILESVIKNFTNFPDVVEEAKAQLAIIKKQEAKTNDSIETDDEN